MIRKATKREVVRLIEIVRAASASMSATGIDQWDEVYPNADVLKHDIAEGNLYVIEENKIVQGMVVLNEFQDKEYADICWKYTNGKQLVVHRLCVHPDFQGMGVAKKLMVFAEEYARKTGYASIRLDSFTQNPTSEGLYTKLGYIKVGTVTFRKGIFYCFEKDVTCELL